MKNITFSVLCRGLLLYTLLSYQLFAQLTSISNSNVISEGNFYTNVQGELYCDAVGFNNLNSGVYFYRIEVFELGGRNKFFTDSKKMVLVK